MIPLRILADIDCKTLWDDTSVILYFPRVVRFRNLMHSIRFYLVAEYV
jgi:hypothetical protein